MGANLTITAPWWAYVLFLAAVAAVIGGAFWAGRLDLRDKRVFAGIRETTARFDQMRALAERSRRRLTDVLDRLAEATEAAEPYWEPDLRRIGDVRGAVLDAEPEPVLVPDGDRDVEPDDGEAYPPSVRATYGAGRLPFEPRGDEQQAVWSVNRGPGAHRRVRARGDDTQRFSPVEVLDAAGVGGTS